MASLEERIRRHEHDAMMANVYQQNIAKHLDGENRKIKTALMQALGLDHGEDMDTDVLIGRVIAEKRDGPGPVVNRNKLPTPPAEGLSVAELTVALRPSEDGGQGHSELQLISSAESEDVTVPCYVSYELLMSLIDEHDPLASELRALEFLNSGAQ